MAVHQNRHESPPQPHSTWRIISIMDDDRRTTGERTVRTAREEASMGSVRRASAWLGLVDDGSDEQYYDEEYTDYTEGPQSADAWATDPQVRAVGDATEEQGPCIATVTPNSFRDARGIGELFRDGIPVVMNLTAMEPSDAKRVVDFAAGLQFGLRGSIQRI